MLEKIKPYIIGLTFVLATATLSSGLDDKFIDVVANYKSWVRIKRPHIIRDREIGLVIYEIYKSGNGMEAINVKTPLIRGKTKPMFYYYLNEYGFPRAWVDPQQEGKNFEEQDNTPCLRCHDGKKI